MAFGLAFIDGVTLDGGSNSSILTGLDKTFSTAAPPAVIFQTLSAEHNWPPSNAFTKASYEDNGALGLLNKQLGMCGEGNRERPCCQSCNGSDQGFGNDFLGTVWNLTKKDTENRAGDPDWKLYPAYALTADAGSTHREAEAVASRTRTGHAPGHVP